MREVVDCALDFALSQPREYELINSGLLGRVTKSRPSVEFVILKSAEWLGGSPSENRNLVSALWFMIHGFVMLRISSTMPAEHFPQALTTFHKSIDILVKNRGELKD